MPRLAPGHDRAPWWEREEGDTLWDQPQEPPRASVRQGELWDEQGQPMVAALAPAMPEAAPAVAPLRAACRTLGAAAMPVAKTKTFAQKTRNTSKADIARMLVLSKSIYDGKDADRWFSVPQRSILPRLQLYEGSAEVEDGHVMHSRQRPGPGGATSGHVWFV